MLNHAVAAPSRVCAATTYTRRPHVQESYRHLHGPAREALLWLICSSSGLQIRWHVIFSLLQRYRKRRFQLSEQLIAAIQVLICISHHQT